MYIEKDGICYEIDLNLEVKKRFQKMWINSLKKRFEKLPLDQQLSIMKDMETALRNRIETFERANMEQKHVEKASLQIDFIEEVNAI